MWQLRAGNGQIFRITALPATVGSGPEADVVIAHATIAAEHARLRAGSNGSLVVEASGDAVVGVGQRRVQIGVLKHGEELLLGKLLLVVEQPEAGGERGTESVAPAAQTPRPARPVAAPAAQRTVPADARAATRPGSAESDEALAMRGKRLQFSRQPARRGLLHADFSQLSGGTRLALLAAALILCAGLLWGIARLMHAFH